MKTKLEIIIQVAGDFAGEKITSGRYGNTLFTANGYAVGDPCYWLPDADYDEFAKSARIQAPDAYHGKDRNWHEIEFRGTRAFFRTQSDGNGDFGCCVDSGWVAVVDLKAVPSYNLAEA